VRVSVSDNGAQALLTVLRVGPRGSQVTRELFVALGKRGITGLDLNGVVVKLRLDAVAARCRVGELLHSLGEEGLTLEKEGARKDLIDAP
jgi:hypothetical protein